MQVTGDIKSNPHVQKKGAGAGNYVGSCKKIHNCIFHFLFS